MFLSSSPKRKNRLKSVQQLSFPICTQSTYTHESITKKKEKKSFFSLEAANFNFGVVTFILNAINHFSAIKIISFHETFSKL